MLLARQNIMLRLDLIYQNILDGWSCIYKTLPTASYLSPSLVIHSQWNWRDKIVSGWKAWKSKMDMPQIWERELTRSVEYYMGWNVTTLMFSWNSYFPLLFCIALKYMETDDRDKFVLQRLVFQHIKNRESGPNGRKYCCH